MTIRCNLALLVAFACAAPSLATPVELRHSYAGAAQTKPSEAGQGKPSASSGSPSKQKGILHLRGTLVEGGAECQRFRASNSKFYTLAGDLRGFRTGDDVEITGKIPRVSHCMQDTTIQVQLIRRAKPSALRPNHTPKSP